MSNRLKVGILMAIGLVCLVAMTAYAADGDFSGKWKGEAKATPLPARGAPGPAGAGAAAGATAPAATGNEAPPAALGGGGGGGGGRGGGGRGGGGGGGFPAGGFGGGGNSQKVSLNLKQSKDNKLSGNITFGDNTDDVKDGKVEGGKISFSAGRAPQPIYAFTGEMKGDELVLTRIAPAGGRGARTTEYVLTKK